MLDHLKTERQQSGGRLRAYMTALLIMGGALVVIYKTSSQDVATPEPPTVPAAPPPLTVDVERLPADTDVVHTAYDAAALEYLSQLSERRPYDSPERITPAALAARPFDAVRGEVFEVQGRITSIHQEVHGRGDLQRLWSVVVEGEDGGRVVFLKLGRASDFEAGRPEDAWALDRKSLEEGQRVLARGIVLQRRTGTIGSALLRDPVPVLVAAPPSFAFRLLEDPAAPIGDLVAADFDDIEDEFLAQTRSLDEPALYQVVQWAREQGADALREALRSGELPSEHWGAPEFERWSKELEDPDGGRSFTLASRGRVFYTEGILVSRAEEGWKELPRGASAWGVHSLEAWHLWSDYYGNVMLRMYSPFPISAFPGVEPDAARRRQNLRVYGVFLKNHTYEKPQKSRKHEGAQLVTSPFFVVLHVESYNPPAPPYDELVWVISGLIVLLAGLFWLVLRGSEKKQAQELEARRLAIRRRARGDSLEAPAGEEPDPPGGEASGSDTSGSGPSGSGPSGLGGR